MAHERKPYFLALVLLIFGTLKCCVLGEPRVPCYFIFGDSLVDGGNNNNLQTHAKVDHLPYGIDFPKGPTGRFCNGRTTADVIGELLGFDDFIPSFLTANGTKILKGINYASGSAGIRYETGKKQGVNIELSRQLQNHQVTVSRIADLLGNNDTATKYLNKCLYSFVIGNNDYINNYFLPKDYNTSKLYTPERYADVLIEEYRQQIMTLYNYGARLVTLTGIAPIGCTPGAVSSYGTNGSLCVDHMNDAANIFNRQLKSLVQQLSANITDAKFVYLSTYGLISKYISLPGFGLKVTGCCKVNDYGLCIPNESPCPLRKLHLFWDSFHPTETVNKITAKISYLALKKIL